ncbi:MAG: undecaprenyldiphospho-muramoylpentapeptide beta-N-acetylglucosaminyltransferase [Syntrophales bacterium]
MKIIIAGGGTGGHLFPGIAIAEEFLRRDSGTAVLFIGTGKGLEKRILPGLGFPLKTMDIEGIKGKGIRKSFAALLKIPWSLVQASRMIRDFKPDIVIGVGGYASGPAVLAAHWMGIRTVIAEQNAIPGVTNRILGVFADRVFLSFPETRAWFRADKAVVSGNPVRPGFHECGRREGKDRMFTVLIFGGSQGARSINRAVAQALPHLREISGTLQIIHQTGDRDLQFMENAYRAAGIHSEVLPFITDMMSAYSRADLLVCRAGATSIAEITACGKAAVLIPFPHAVNDHQTKNAEVLYHAGAAEMIHEKDLDGKRLADTIRRLHDDPGRIRAMEEKSAALGNIRAAETVVDECMALMRRVKR